MAEGYQEFTPAPALSPYVDRLWVRSTAARPADRPLRILPDGCIDVVVTLGPSRNGFVVGAMTRALLYQVMAPADMLGVRFRPGGALPFLGVPAQELTDTMLQSDEPAFRWLAREQVFESTRLRDALGMLERSLLRRLRVIGPPDPLVAYVVARLSGPGAPPVATLASHVSWSRQHLGRVFRHHVGLSPKEFARIARLQRAIGCLQRSPATSLGQAAAALGYFDQAHMSRDFRELAGLTPGEAASAASSIRPIQSLFPPIFSPDDNTDRYAEVGS
jgi:AraC-like DNA-binding protein